MLHSLSRRSRPLLTNLPIRHNVTREAPPLQRKGPYDLHKGPHIGAHAYDRLALPVGFSETVEDINSGGGDLEVTLATHIKKAREVFAAAASGKQLRKMPSEIAAPMPEGQFRMERDAYKAYLDECRQGNVTYLRLFNNQEQAANVMFFGANFDSGFPLKNLYKALNVVKPDTILVQLPPDVFYTYERVNKVMIPSDGDPNLEFIQDLERGPADVIPSLKYKNQVQKLLR